MNEEFECLSTCIHLVIKAHELGLYEACELSRCIYEREFTDIDCQKLEMWDEMLETLIELISIVKIHSEATKNNFAWAEVDGAKKILERAKQIKDGGEV